MLSDTHGNVGAARAAARRMAAEGIEMAFHCGDVGGWEVPAEWAATIPGVPLKIVSGNCDPPGEERFFPSEVGVEHFGRFGEAVVAGRRIAWLHGDDRRRFEEALRCGRFDFLFFGHTHRPADFREGATRCVNPGSAGRGRPKTAAVLDLASGELRPFEIEA